MNFTLKPDSRRPHIALVCDEDGTPIEYADGIYMKRPPFRYVPSNRESELRRAIEAQFPQHDIRGISPQPGLGRFEAKTTN